MGHGAQHSRMGADLSGHPSESVGAGETLRDESWIALQHRDVPAFKRTGEYVAGDLSGAYGVFNSRSG
jgi:hypothetical protein